MADRGDEGKRNVQKFYYLENKKEFFGKIKSIFTKSFLLVKYVKIEDASFKFGLHQCKNLLIRQTLTHYMTF